MAHSIHIEAVDSRRVGGKTPQMAFTGDLRRLLAYQGGKRRTDIYFLLPLYT
jgi:hypothetical protein